jgi:hypothetical protein
MVRVLYRRENGRVAVQERASPPASKKTAVPVEIAAVAHKRYFDLPTPHSCYNFRGRIEIAS